MRRLKDARVQAESVENYLSGLNSAYRQAAGAEEKQKQLIELINQSFQGTTALGAASTGSHVIQEITRND